MKVADCPSSTVWFAGCDTIDGGACTVSVAMLLVWLPILILVGGWVYNYATTQEVLREDRRRIELLESTSLTLKEYEDKHKVLTERLDRIEAKIDGLSANGSAADAEEIRKIRKEWSSYRSHR